MVNHSTPTVARTYTTNKIHDKYRRIEECGIEPSLSCRRELHMLSPRTLREILPDEAKHQSMKRAPSALPSQSSSSSTSSPTEEIAADPPQITEAANEELSQELQNYAGVKTSQIVSKYQQLTGQKPESESKPELEPGQVSIPHAEWDPRRSSMWGECPKCKKMGHHRKEESDKHGSYEVYWMHPDIKNYVWKVCKIETEVKRQQEQEQVEEETQETYQIDPKDYDLNDLQKYDRPMLIRIIQYLHEKLKLKAKRAIEVTNEITPLEKMQNYCREHNIRTKRQYWEALSKGKIPTDLPQTKRADYTYGVKWNVLLGKNRAE